jgi:hypothetical protein
MTLEPGVHYDIPDTVYHSDPAPLPSLSASIARTILETCPARGAYNHPRLNPLSEPYEQTADMAEGSALHRLMLDAGANISVINFPDYKKDAAKEARKFARRMGMIPILAHRYEELKTIANRVRAQLRSHPEARIVLDNDVYASEVTMIWQEDSGCYCRIRADRAPRFDPSLPIYDLKFTSRLKSPLDWDRTVFDSWWDMRAAFYQRGSATLRDGIIPPYRFIVVEKEAPSDIFVMQLTPHFLKIGEQKAEAAIDTWERCHELGEFPGYPRRVFHVAPPGWAESKWLERPPLEMMCPAPARRSDDDGQGSMLDWIQQRKQKIDSPLDTPGVNEHAD